MTLDEALEATRKAPRDAKLARTRRAAARRQAEQLRKGASIGCEDVP